MLSYPLDDESVRQMPCRPSDIHINGYYALSEANGYDDHIREAVGRIVFFCQKQGVWTGVHKNDFIRMIQEDLCVFAPIATADRDYQKAMELWQDQVGIYNIWSLLTIGFYRIFVQKPVQPTDNRPKVNLPKTGVYGDFGFFIPGLRWLVRQRYVIEELTPDDKYVIYPTLKMVELLLSHQSQTH